MLEPWPTKEESEAWQIKQFVKMYGIVFPFKKFVVETKHEKPDFKIRDTTTGNYYGVELTSVYIDDQSVPIDHIPTLLGKKIFEYKDSKLYRSRILASVKNKIQKAEKGYDTENPIILSVYLNEYIKLTKNFIESLVSESFILNNIEPFKAIILWPLPNWEFYYYCPN